MAVKLIDELQKEIKAAGEAVKQEAYEKAYDHVFQILDNLEKLLNDNRYLEGNEITEEDKRLYDILIRFDAVYYFKQRLNRKALRDYDNLWNYAKELYSIPEYKEFADFEKIKQEELLGTKEENPYQIVGLGLDEAISVNMVDHADHEKNLGWEFVYDKDNVDPVLDIQFLSEAYYKADDDYTGRTTVPALIDVKTGKVVNNDYHKLTNYFEVDFKPFHKKNAPDLYPEELRNEIDEMNYWLFDNINNGVYKTTFCRSKEAYWDAYNSFYAAMDLLEERLENRRFLFGDYVTDSDVRLYVTLARLDIRYTHQLGHTKHPLFTYKNLWAYARDLYQIPAFKNNTYFKDFANPDNKKQGRTFESFNARFLDEIDFDAYWGAPHNRARLSSDPGNKFRTEKQD